MAFSKNKNPGICKLQRDNGIEIKDREEER
jgi:hypothetical protein